MSYWFEFNRITKRYERQYSAKINKVLKGQIETYIQTGDVDAINADGIYKVLKDMHAQVGVNWAAKSNKYLRAKKARQPLGFSERIVQILQSQYGPDLLNMSQNISQTTKDQIRTILQQAVKEGWSIDEITSRLKSPALTAARSQLIARTEVIGAANAGAMANAQTLGATHKVWISAIDKRTRRDHITLDGQKVGINEYFTVVDKNGVTRRMMQPGDKTGGPAQVCNCRCAVGFEMGSAQANPMQSITNKPIPEPANVVDVVQDITLENNLNKAIDEAKKWADSLKPEEQLNFLEYSTGSYEKINSQLRDANKYSEYNFSEGNAIMSKNIKSAPKYQGAVYRGLRFYDEKSFSKYINDLQSGVFVEKAYMSTSYHEDKIVDFFLDSKFRIKLVINGKNGVIMQHLSTIPSEGEVIFDKGSKFKFDRIIEEIKTDKYTQITIQITEL